MRLIGKKRYLLWWLGGLAALLLLPVLFLALILEYEPLVGPGKVAAATDAARTRQLAERSYKALQNPGGTFNLSFSEDELNSFMAFIGRGLRGSAGRAEVAADGLTTFLTLQIRDNPLGRYVNLTVTIRGSQTGLEIGAIRLGHLRIPGLLVTTLAPPIMDLFLGRGIGHLAFNSISSLAITDKNVSLSGRTSGDLNERLDRAKKRLKEVRDQVAYLGDPLLVRLYYQQLMETDRSLPSVAPVSLVRYTGPLFALARQRGGEAATENQAALLALAIFLGEERIEVVVGPVRTASMKDYQPRLGKVTLAGREDLCLHFLISAALRIITERGISVAIGEFKELLDAGRKGGSGFSFVDLAADRAGVRFAELAISDDAQAALCQQRMAVGEEALFFPDIAGLPEEIYRQEFERYFHDVESVPYLAMVAAIDRCLDRLPLYRGALSPANSGSIGGRDCQIAEVMPVAMRQGLASSAIKVATKETKVPRPVVMGHPLPPQTQKAPPLKTPVVTGGERKAAGLTARLEDDKPKVTVAALPMAVTSNLIVAPDRAEHREPPSQVNAEPKSQEERLSEQRIKKLQEKLEILRQHYTEKHPDVRAVLRELETLQNR